MSDKIEGVPLGMRIARVEKRPSWVDYWATLEPDNVYNKPLDQVPDPPGRKRREPLEFRVPRTDEHYISVAGTPRIKPGHQGFTTEDHRRIILEPPAPPQAWVFIHRHTAIADSTHNLVSNCGPASDTFYGTATELPQKGTPEWEALVERLAVTLGCSFGKHSNVTILGLRRGTSAILDDLLGGAK